VRVKDRFNPTVLDSGVRELLGFQQRMKGCVELALPDRLSLDTRVKYEAPPPPVVRKVR
jgi:mediator of RNA polymerase II transcription subunit 18